MKQTQPAAEENSAPAEKVSADGAAHAAIVHDHDLAQMGANGAQNLVAAADAQKTSPKEPS